MKPGRKMRKWWPAVNEPCNNCSGGDSRTVREIDAPPGPAKGKTVLVVDDDPAVLGSLKFSLEVEGFSVRCYESPAAFLAARDLPRRACLVVDQKLPGISGLDMLALLADDRRAAMPAILITSHPSPALLSRARSAGVTIVEKPILNNALSEAIHEAMTCKQ